MRRSSLFLAASIAAGLAALLSVPAHGTAAYSQPHDGSGTLNKSSWYAPDGLDGDVYCWDNFSLATATAITEVHWRGGYQYHPSGTGQAPIASFEVSIWASIGGNSQPDVVSGRLVNYTVNDAHETAAGSFGGQAMYDYSYSLPSPFQAAAGAVYWVRIVASQGIVAPSYAPDWGLATGTGGNGKHFQNTTGAGYQAPFSDLALWLAASSAPTVTIAASAQPSWAGTVSGAGAYPTGSTASLTATANPNEAFAKWTENGATVSTNATYTFTANANRTLVAVFDTAYTIATSAWPSYAGTTTGDGVYRTGATVTVTATPANGFVFTQWSDGTTTPTYAFPAASDAYLTAYFASAPNAATFDFDSGPYHAGLPLAWTVNGLTATMSGDFSTQPVGTLGIAPAGMSGWYLYPGSVFASDLVIDFSAPLVDFSVLYAVDELACDVSARMRVTAYSGSVAVGTNTMIAVAGTYPSATLAISVPAGFDRAVVHWDAPGQLCQDYGPIFFADNVTVTMAGALAVGGGRDAALRLWPPAPNPAHGATALRFTLPAAGEARLAVYDLAGRRVRSLVSGTLAAGEHAMRWDGADDTGRPLAPGVYRVRLDAAGRHDARTCVLVR